MRGKVRRSHIVVTHGNENFQVRILCQSITQGSAGVYIVVVSVPIPRRGYAATEDVVFEIALIAQLCPPVVIEGRGVRRANCSFARVKVRTVSGQVGVITLEPGIEPPD